MTCIHDRSAQLTQERYVWAPDPLWPRGQDQWESISCGLVGEMYASPAHFCHADVSSLALTTPALPCLKYTPQCAFEQKKYFPCHVLSSHLSLCTTAPEQIDSAQGP